MKKDEAKHILNSLGMPTKQQADLCAHTLLALAGLNETAPWREASNRFIRIHDVLQFISENYSVTYAENSRETFRKQAMHPFRTAALIEDNNKPTNSPNYQYKLTDEALDLLRTYNSDSWDSRIENFLMVHGTLKDKYSNKRKLTQIPLMINDSPFMLSSGAHNELQKAIIDEFASRFAQGGIVLYLGDTRKKNLYRDQVFLQKLGVEITDHDKLPDVILYRPEKDWLYFIEAVTSVGPMSAKRLLEIQDITRNCICGKIYVTAFPSIQTYKKFAADLAWETEVWISDNPDHLIHLNGDMFIGPR